ncbi:hypothetical protein PIB30_033857 [Stylosanthes scabra]|uniref:Uncharacterized protein n=1 Tax=Stylosanthes scabra TaxID=79078 RepID=A0ABU6RCT7_9FABA|nr:hypothetical protein [Stylosanthes scabra]
MKVLSMFQKPRFVALKYEKPETYETGLIPPTRPFGRMWLCGVRDNHPYLGLVVFMGTHNTSIQGQASIFISFLLISLWLSVQTHTMKAAMEKQKAQFEAANQYWHKINSKNEQKIDYLCWGVQQVNPYLKGRLPEDIPEWMQANVQAGRGRFSDGMSHIPRKCWPGATSAGAASASKNVEDKGNGKAEEGDNDERGKKKAWEARDKDLNE